MNNDNLQNKRHSLAHLLAAAVMKLYPDAKRTIGPAIDNGFYFDFEFAEPINDADLKKIEKQMRKMFSSWDKFERSELTADEAKKEYPGNEYKHELIDEFTAGGEKVSFYKSGDYWDLCKGGHVESMKEIDKDSFKLDRLAGAYWRGDEKNKMLTRIYGLAFDTKEELDSYLVMVEEAKKRDHRILGPQLDLFFFHEFSPGIPFYLPKGTIVRNELEKFVREISYGKGYSEVRLPQMFDSQVFKTSGHWEHYKDDMFTFKVEERDFGLKPMNCPGHMLLFKQGLYSYRDLPLRLAEMTTLYRNELSGVLSGLTRVRAFGQDDCHIFLAPEQISDEVAELLGRIKRIYSVFGMEVQDVALSTKPEKALGSKEEWKQAEDSLAAALKKAGWDYEINPGDGAFYGPKIDMQIKDALGRKWQLATIQLDFQQPARFELEYVSDDGSRKTPVVIHRAILGSFERFMAIIIEQFAGSFPLWLAPVQVKVIAISEKHVDYAHEVAKKLEQMLLGIRVEIDERNESMGKKIREAAKQKIPYLAVVGDKEIEDKAVAVRGRGDQDLGSISIDEFAKRLKEEIETKKI